MTTQTWAEETGRMQPNLLSIRLPPEECARAVRQEWTWGPCGGFLPGAGGLWRATFERARPIRASPDRHREGGGCVDFMAKLAAPERLENAERNAHARMRGLFGNEISPYPVTFTVAGESGKPSREDIYCFAPYEVFAELHRHPDQWKLFTLRESPPAHPKTATLSKCSEYRELGASCRPRGAIIGPS